METLLRGFPGIVRRCVLFFLGLSALHAQAASISSNGSGGGAWSSGSSWSGGNVPGTSDVVTIKAGDQINITGNQTCAGLTLKGVLALNSNNKTLTVNGNLSIQGAASITGTNANRELDVSGNISITSAFSLDIAGMTLVVTGTSQVDGELTFSSTTGTKTFTGDMTITGKVDFDAAETIAVGGRLLASSGSHLGGGSASGTINAAGILRVTSGTVHLDGLTVNTGGVQISGTGILDASGADNNIGTSGDWANTSSAGNAFVEGTTSTVTFNGATGTQLIQRTAGTETFCGLAIANTSATSPGVRTQVDVQVNDDFDQSSGVFDLNGHAFTLTGSSTAETHNLSGSLVSGVAGASFTITDPSSVNRLMFANYGIGTSAQNIPINVTCGRISFTGFTEWGTASFTKTTAQDDIFAGGNYYHGPVTFNANSSASRWRMGDGTTALPDTFVNATFNANALSGANNNFIVGANSLGNAFYGTTNMYSTTSGGFFVGRNNGGTGSSATFHGPVIARVALTGNITFADASVSNPSSVTFQGTVQAISATSSTGDIFFGGSAYSTVTLTPTAQFIPGTLQGLTSVNFRNVTQNGTLAQQITGGTGLRIFCGGSTYPNTFNGAVTFTGDTVQLASTTFNANASITAQNMLTLAGSTFSGAQNDFTKNGTTASTSTGGNTFAAGSMNTFTSTGTGAFTLAGTTADDMNGDVKYIQTGSGALQPAFGATCTYAGLVSTVGTSTAIQFAAGAGTVVLDGSAQKIDGAAATAPTFKRLTLAGTVQTTVPLAVTTLLTMTSGKLDLNGNTLTLGTAAAAPGTLSYTNGWMYGGSLKRWFNTGTIAMGNAAGLFPVGTSGASYHPLWFGYTSTLSAGGTVTVQHTPTGTGINTAHFMDPGWGNMVTGVSNAAWTLSTGDGLALNGSTGAVRYGGTGFTPFSLTDLNACQGSGVIGTFTAATSTAVPLEVNRSGLNTGALARTWVVGTRNNVQSPLPIELLYFTARPEGDEVVLQWATASEQDNARFDVERSRDGRSFMNVLSRPGAGDSQYELHYEGVDPAPFLGASYYRLKQTDLDGVFTYSDVVPVSMRNADDGLTFFPNPATLGSLVVQLPQGGMSVHLAAFDDLGRVVIDRTMQVDASGRILLQGSELTRAGAYHVIAESGGIRYHGTLIVQ